MKNNELWMRADSWVKLSRCSLRNDTIPSRLPVLQPVPSLQAAFVLALNPVPTSPAQCRAGVDVDERPRCRLTSSMYCRRIDPHPSSNHHSLKPITSPCRLRILHNQHDTARQNHKDDVGRVSSHNQPPLTTHVLSQAPPKHRPSPHP